MNDLREWASSKPEIPDLPFYVYTIEPGPWPTHALPTYIPDADNNGDASYEISTSFDEDGNYLKINAPEELWGNKSATAKMLGSLKFIFGQGDFPDFDSNGREDIKPTHGEGEEPEPFLKAKNQANLGVLTITRAYMRHVIKDVGGGNWERKSQAVLFIEKVVDEFAGKFIVQWEWEPKFDKRP